MQAALFRRARASVSSGLPILDGLQPIAAGADPRELEGLRLTVRLNLTQLLTELGEVGGPRAPRVDLLFELLMGPERSSDATAVGGLLGRLRERLGLGVGQVNAVEEEQQLTNFRVLVDYVEDLRTAWDSARSSVDRRSAEYEGGQVHRVLTGLGTVQAAAQRVESALDAAGQDRARRDEMLIELTERSSLTVTEYLDWVRSFASREGPRLLRAGGGEGARVIASVAERLHEIVERSALRTLLETVAAELAELEKSLDRLYEDAFIQTDEPPDDETDGSDDSDEGRDKHDPD